MKNPLAQNRAGFSLAEVLVAMTITAVIGVSMTGLFVAQSRFLAVQQKQAFARGVTRSASNIVMSELRMIERDSGVVAASDTSITVRIPFAMGVACSSTLNVLNVSMLPADSLMYASGAAAMSGLAYRKTDGTYHYVATTTAPATGTVANLACAGAGVTVLTSAGGAARSAVTVGTLAVPVGAPVLFYSTVRYHFSASTSVTGRRGLWRQVAAANLDEELVAPFDNTARFNYFVNDAETAQTTAPSALSTITGIELVMNSVSERANADGTYTMVPLRTAVFFKNRRN